MTDVEKKYLDVEIAALKVQINDLKDSIKELRNQNREIIQFVQEAKAGRRYLAWMIGLSVSIGALISQLVTFVR